MRQAGAPPAPAAAKPGRPVRRRRPGSRACRSRATAASRCTPTFDRRPGRCRAIVRAELLRRAAACRRGAPPGRPTGGRPTFVVPPVPAGCWRPARPRRRRSPTAPGLRRPTTARPVPRSLREWQGGGRGGRIAAGRTGSSASKARAGVDDVRKKAMTFAEQNVASSFEFARKLAQARDLEEVVRLQTEFAKTQMQVLGEQAKELGAQATRATRETGKRKS